jgi:hypothetical protein
MDPDDHCRCRYPDDYYRRRFGMIFCVPSIFPMAVIFSAAMARKNAAGSVEQGGNAH